MKIVMVFPCMD